MLLYAGPCGSLMLVIISANNWQLISCRQDVKAAWRFAHFLQWRSGVRHYVGRI